MTDEADRRALATGRSGTGPRLVLVHGFTQTGRSWAYVERLLRPHHEVVTVDLPGHGGSGSIEAADLDEAGELLANAGGAGTYVGYSLGGRVALHAAFARPEAVERLVLVGTSPGLDDEQARAERRRADESLADRLDGANPISLDVFLAEWLSGPLFSHLDAASAGLEARRENTTTGLARSLRTQGTGTQHYAPERLAALTMPVLVVAGALDERFVAIGRQVVSLIGSNAKFAELSDVGHAAPFEDPAGFAALLEDWLGT